MPRVAEGQKPLALELVLEQKLSIFQVPTMSPPHPVALPQVPLRHPLSLVAMAYGLRQK